MEFLLSTTKTKSVPKKKESVPKKKIPSWIKKIPPMMVYYKPTKELIHIDDMVYYHHNYGGYSNYLRRKKKEEEEQKKKEEEKKRIETEKKEKKEYNEFIQNYLEKYGSDKECVPVINDILNDQPPKKIKQKKVNHIKYEYSPKKPPLNKIIQQKKKNKRIIKFYTDHQHTFTKKLNKNTNTIKCYFPREKFYQQLEKIIPNEEETLLPTEEEIAIDNEMYGPQRN